MKEKIKVTVVRNDRLDTEGRTLRTAKRIPAYDIVKIIGAADVRLAVMGKPTKVALVGDYLVQPELEDLCSIQCFDVTVLAAKGAA